MRYNKLLLWVALAIALSIRLLYIHQTTLTVYTPDSAGYYDSGKATILQPYFTTVFNPYRTPLYPLFIQTIYGISGVLLSNPDTQQFLSGARAVSAVQTLFGLLGLLIFHALLKDFRVSDRWRIFGVLFVGLDIMIFTNERVMLTETLTIVLLLITTWIGIRTVNTPTSANFFLLFILSAVLFLLRPVYVLFPIPIACCALWIHRTRHVLILSLLGITLFLLIPLSYRAVNLYTQNYNGINRTVDINILGRILFKNISIESATGMPYYHEIVAYRKTSGPIDNPYIFLSTLDPNIYQNTKRMNELQQFTFRIVTANFSGYFLSVVRDIPSALTAIQPPDVLLIPATAAIMNSFFRALVLFYQGVQYVFLSFLVLMPLQIIHTIRQPTRQNGMLLALGTITAYQISMTLFFGFGEFGRLLSITHPQLFLFCFLWFEKLFHFR